MYNQDNSDQNQGKKRKHAKIRLPEILKEATPQQGVHWIEPDKCFEINWDLFVPFYHQRANSTAKLTNIMNNFTRARNGFQRDLRSAGVGYDAVYCASGSLPAPKGRPTQPVLVVPQPEDLLGSLFECEREVSLMKVVQRLMEKLSYTPNDMSNMLTLLTYEVIEKKPNTHINKEELDCFLRRFGPIDLILDKMRDFIRSGANDWYHGNVSRERSENLLKEYLKTNSSAFLIRAKSSPGQNVVFVISFGFSSLPSPLIFHTQIFSIKSKLITGIQKDNQQQKEEVLSSVIGILDFLNPKPLFAVQFPHLRFLVEGSVTHLPTPPIDHYDVPNDILQNLSSCKI